MRSGKDLARWSQGRRSDWRRRLGAVGVVVAAALALVGSVWVATGLYVDWLWFDSLGYGAVYRTQVASQVVLLLAGAGLFGLLYIGSLRLARRLGDAGAGVIVAGEGLWTFLARVSAGLGRDTARVRRAERTLLGLGAALALGFGLSAAASWEVWLPALNAVPFGLSEPFFGRDVGFYIFTLPLLRAMHAWLLAAVAAIGLATIVAYLVRSWLELGLRPRRALAELGRPAQLHLAGLGAAIFGLIALQHQLSLAEVVLATSGQAFRLSFPGYVEANARVPAFWLETLGAVAAGALLVAAARGRPGRRLVLGPAVWLATLLLGALYPAAVQALVVKPNEALVERPYLERVIGMSKAAYGLDRLVERPVAAEESLRPDVAQANLPTLSNLRLWEPEPLRLGLNQLQAGKPYYGFFQYPDLDRYLIGGQTRALLVAARELDPQALPARSWVNTRLQFTHGYGLVAATAGAVGPDGRPVLLERDLPPRGDLSLTRPEIYFGERTTEPALVRTSEAEIDYPRGDENVPTHYESQAGVSLGGPIARLAHALRLNDPNLVLSPAIGPETALLYRRQIAERVQRLAPFLVLDADAYPVVLDDRLIWLLDGYTATDRFPLAPRTPARLLSPGPPGSPSRSVEPNYLRGAIKATVDAYDGAVNFYLADPGDPIAASYARIYPGLLQPLEALPATLKPHLRYPRQLFAVQADVLARFHVADPAQLYSGEDAWLVARARFDARPEALPSYALQRLPGEPSEELALTLPYRPYSQANDRHNLVALLAARSDPPHYGELILYRYPRERPVEGPFQAELRIDQDPTVSAQFGLWQRSGAQLIRGDIQTLPLGNSVLYFESVYLQRAERTALPELQRVVLVANGRVVMEPTLEAALGSLFGGGWGTGTDPGQPTPNPRPRREAAPQGPTPELQALAASAQDHLRRAQEALLVGDRARHDQELAAAQADLQRLAETGR